MYYTFLKCVVHNPKMCNTQFELCNNLYTFLRGGDVVDRNRKNELKRLCWQYAKFRRNRDDRKVQMIEDAMHQAAEPWLYAYTLKAVTQGIPYEKLNAQTRVPCNKNMFYRTINRFYLILDKLRD